MKVFITGAHGQLGTDIVNLFSRDHQVIGVSRQELDITDFFQVISGIHRIKPDVIIHAAGYTQVDQAENDHDRAYLVNAFGTRNLAVAAQHVGAKIIYISTDYVFDGKSSIPYKEFDHANPLNVYGRSKLAGEELVKTLSNKYFIVRTSWLFGLHGNNFVKTMLKLAQNNAEISVVDDQVGSPTNTMDLACFLKELSETEKYGIYHASNTGICSWYEFAKAVFEEAGIVIKVIPVQSKDFTLPALRPAFSALDHMGIRLNGFSDFRHWREALKEHLALLYRIGQLDKTLRHF